MQLPPPFRKPATSNQLGGKTMKTTRMFLMIGANELAKSLDSFYSVLCKGVRAADTSVLYAAVVALHTAPYE